MKDSNSKQYDSNFNLLQYNWTSYQYHYKGQQ